MNHANQYDVLVLVLLGLLQVKYTQIAHHNPMQAAKDSLGTFSSYHSDNAGERLLQILDDISDVTQGNIKRAKESIQ